MKRSSIGGQAVMEGVMMRSDTGIAMAVRRICESIIRNEHSILPISSLICGHYGLEDVCMGVPTVVGRNGAETVLDIPLNGLEQRKLMASADALRKVLDGIEL